MAEIRRLLADATVQVPERLVQPLPGGGSLFVMPALDGRIAITKLITFTPANAGTARPAIQGDVIVFDAATGERMLVLDGPTVTARRTAAVSLLAAQCLAPNKDGPLLIVGAGAQGRAHLEAFAQGLPLQREVRIASRSAASAQALAAYARTLGPARRASSPTPMRPGRLPAGRDLHAGRRRGAVRAAARRRVHRGRGFVHAGAWSNSTPPLCRHCADNGTIVRGHPGCACTKRATCCRRGSTWAHFAPLDEMVAGAGWVNGARCCSRAAAGPAGTWPRRGRRCAERPRHALGSVTPCCPWYLPPRSL